MKRPRHSLKCPRVFRAHGHLKHRATHRLGRGSPLTLPSSRLTAATTTHLRQPSRSLHRYLLILHILQPLILMELLVG